MQVTRSKYPSLLLFQVIRLIKARLFSLEIVITPEVNDHEIPSFKALSV